MSKKRESALTFNLLFLCRCRLRLNLGWCEVGGGGCFQLLVVLVERSRSGFATPRSNSGPQKASASCCGAVLSLHVDECRGSSLRDGKFRLQSKKCDEESV